MEPDACHSPLFIERRSRPGNDMKTTKYIDLVVSFQDQYTFLHDAILEASEGYNTIINLAEFTKQKNKLLQKATQGKTELQLQFEVRYNT